MEYELNIQKIEALTEEYVQASRLSRREQIETELLEETLWKAQKQYGRTPFAEFTEEELQVLSEAIDADDTEASRLIRRAYIDQL